MSAVDSAKTWMNERPKQAMAGVAIIAILVGIVLGFGAGYKVEHDRTASDVSRLKKASPSASKTTKTTKPATGGKVKPAANGQTRRVGEVTAASATSITLKTKTGSVTVALSSSTPIDKLSKGSLNDVVVGRRALVAPGPEILILREGSTLGRSVKTKTSDSVTLAAENGLPAGKLKSTSSTPVDTVTNGAATDIKVGDHVLVFGTAKSGAVTATQVIIVPTTSKFSA